MLPVIPLVGLLLRVKVRDEHARLIAVGVAALVLLDIAIVISTQPTRDYLIFWRAGRDLWDGLDPYDAVRFAESPFLHPPTALPVFALFGALPYRSSVIVWTVFNVMFCTMLPALAGRALRSQENDVASPTTGCRVPEGIDTAVLTVLTSVLIVSDAFRYGLFTGQLGVFTALALLSALTNQGQGRRIMAGIWLGVATIKASTMVPFLLLFLRRRDLRTWIALILTCLVLCAMAGPPQLLPARLSLTLQRIVAMGAEGQVNDYSFSGSQFANMIGFDHALYRLGLRNRTVIRLLQIAAIALMGLWIAKQILRSRLSRPALCSLVTLYSVLFFYHRIYDTVVLILPLAYGVGRARVAGERSRWWFVVASLAILLVLFLSGTGLKSLTEASFQWGLRGRVVQAFVLPYATWMILIAMACVYMGDTRRAA